MPATVELEQDIFFGNAVMGTAKLGGKATGFGFRAGVQYRPRMLDKLSVGLAYRSKVKLDFSGKTKDARHAAHVEGDPPSESRVVSDVAAEAADDDADVDAHLVQADGP